ncbi:MAG: hypothetical protein PHO37_10310 [Kiritimatiellae bacterium]|nr:hypothetical protein [Kiritimatiellia bacterium]
MIGFKKRGTNRASADDAAQRCWWTIEIMLGLVRQHGRRDLKPQARLSRVRSPIIRAPPAIARIADDFLASRLGFKPEMSGWKPELRCACTNGSIS